MALVKLKPKIKNAFLKNFAGNTTYIEINWKTFADELPIPEQQIYVIVRLKKEYSILPGIYKETYNNNGKLLFRYVKFNHIELTEIYFHGPKFKKMIAWGRFKYSSTEKQN